MEGLTDDGFTLDDLNIRFGSDVIAAMVPGESYCYDAYDPERAFFFIDDEVCKTAGRLRVLNITLGNSLEDVVSTFGLSRGQARINYEYDSNGDGYTELGEFIFDGKLADWDKDDLLVQLLFIFFQYDNGKLELINLNKNKPDDFPEVLMLCFSAIDTTQGEYDSISPRTIFRMECKLLQNR